MAVLVEAISVIVKREAIVLTHRGGWNAFLKQVPNATFCADDELVRVGFMHPTDVEIYVRHLEAQGLTFLRGGKAADIAIVDQRSGLISDCDWLEFARLRFGDEGGTVSACWHFDQPRIAAGIHLKGESFGLATPEGWTYEDSLSKDFIFVPTDIGRDHPRFLRSEDGLDVYLDPETGREVWQPRPSGQGGGKQ